MDINMDEKESTPEKELKKIVKAHNELVLILEDYTVEIMKLHANLDTAIDLAKDLEIQKYEVQNLVIKIAHECENGKKSSRAVKNIKKLLKGHGEIKDETKKHEKKVQENA